MAADFLAWLFEATMALSAAIVLVMMLRRPLRMVFGAPVAYAAWLALPLSVVAVCLPARQMPVAPTTIAPEAVVSMSELSTRVVAETMDRTPMIVLAWLVGALLTAMIFARAQARFVRSLGILHPREDGTWQAESDDGLPATVGWRRPRIVLPASFEQRYSRAQRALILLHERTHLARGDAFTNALFVFARVLFWFNPLLLIAHRAFRHDQELACDARVVARHPRARRLYGEAMLRALTEGPHRSAGVHWGFAHPLRERIQMLKQMPPSTARRRLGVFTVAVASLTCAVASWAAQPPEATASAPKGDEDFEARVSLRIDDGQPSEFVIRDHYGETFVVRTHEPTGDYEWKTRITPSESAGAPAFHLDSQLYRDGELRGEPKLVFAPNSDAVIKMGDEAAGAFKGITIGIRVAPTPSTAASTKPATNATGQAIPASSEFILKGRLVPARLESPAVYTLGSPVFARDLRAEEPGC